MIEAAESSSAPNTSEINMGISRLNLQAPVEPVSYQCDNCFRVFNDELVFKRHILFHFSHVKISRSNLECYMDVRQTRELRFGCKFCDKYYNRSLNLRNHFFSHPELVSIIKTTRSLECVAMASMLTFNSELGEPGDITPESDSVPEPKKVKIMKCNVCCRTFYEEDVFNEHVSKHTEEERRAKARADKRVLKYKLFMEKMHRKYPRATDKEMEELVYKSFAKMPYRCERCEDSFMKRHELDTHVRRHGTEAYRKYQRDLERDQGRNSPSKTWPMVYEGSTSDEE